MKKSIIYLLSGLILTAGACKKSDTTATTTTTTTTGAASTVAAGNYGFDGGSSGKFSATKAGITQTTAAGISTFVISAISDGGNQSITITVLQKITATGRIAFSAAVNNGGIIISKDYTKQTDATLSYSTDRAAGTATTAQKGGGEINITSINGTAVEGTFSATAYNSAGAIAFVEQGTFKGTIN